MPRCTPYLAYIACIASGSGTCVVVLVNSFARSTVDPLLVTACCLLREGPPRTDAARVAPLAVELSLGMACSSSCFRSCSNTGSAAPGTILL